MLVIPLRVSEDLSCLREVRVPRTIRIIKRTASSPSTLQHSHTSAVRRCVAAVSDIPSPPPIARYAAMHSGHFGTNARAILGSAHAAAPRVRRASRLSPRDAAGEAAFRRHMQTGRAPVLSVRVTRAPRHGSRKKTPACLHTHRDASPTRPSCRRVRAHCGPWVSGRGSDWRR
jgi:hypothetical protein